MVKKSLITLQIALGISLLVPSMGHARFTDQGPGGQNLDVVVEMPAQAPARTPAEAEAPKVALSWEGLKSKVKSIWTKITSVTEAPTQNPKSVAAAPATVSQETQESVTQWKTSSDVLKKQDVTKVKEQAKPSNDPNLVMGRNNIPVFEFKKYRARLLKQKVVPVPELSVGSEALLDEGALVKESLPRFVELKTTPVKALETPPVVSMQEFATEWSKPIEVVQGPVPVEIPKLPPEKRISKESIDKIKFIAELEVAVDVKEVKLIEEEDLKLLRALILFEKKDFCHIASGIFSDLLNSKKPDVSLSAHHHLGLCLNVMHMPTQAVDPLLYVLEKPNRFFTVALKTLLQLAPRHSEEKITEKLQGLKEDDQLNKDQLAQLYYLRSKVSYKNGNHQNALKWAQQVPEKSPSYFKAQLLAGLSEHLTGKTSDSAVRLKKLVSDLERKGQDKDLLALAHVNLGRVSFQKAAFKDSVESYQKLSKENALWLQGLTELGWAQLQTKDAPGAIGNMHSIQSPYFDNVYKPESYIVRGIGYLNICQYADAFKTLSYLEQKYMPWIDQMEAYIKATPDLTAYDNALQFMSQKQKTDMAQLPKQVFVEVIRQREFLNDQESINQLVDESNALPFIKGLIQSDRKTLQAKKANMGSRVAQLKEKIRTINANPQQIKNLNLWKAELALNETFLSSYEFKIETFNEGEAGWNKYSSESATSIQKQKTALKTHAGSLMKKQMAKMSKSLRLNLENNELLKYEIYAGSGENIRFQLTAKAGGNTKGGAGQGGDRRVASQKWDFDGEFWEDEIGNYRSSLKNNCKKE